MTENESGVEKLLQAYPDISVTRSRIGQISVHQALLAGKERVMLIYPGRDTEEQDQPDVWISIHTRELNEPPYSQDTFFTFVNARPVGEEAVTIKVDKSQSDINIEEVLMKAKQGLEIFEAFLGATPESSRTITNQRVYDHMGRRGELKEDLQQLGINTESEGVSKNDPEPEDWYLYAKAVLHRPIVQFANS